MTQLGLHFKTALDYIRRSPFRALSALFVLALTFFVATIVFVLVYSSNNLLKYFETRPQIIAFLDSSATAADIAALQTKWQENPNIKEIKYITKDQALAIYKSATSDNPLLGELVSPSIFPASLEFTLVDLGYAEEIVNQLKSEKIVDDVGFTASIGGKSVLKDAISKLKSTIYYLKFGGIVFVLTLGLTSFSVLIVIISMRLATRKSEVEILNLVGASPGFIRAPIVLEAILYVVFGVFTGWIFALILVLYATPSIISWFGSISILPKSTTVLMLLFAKILVLELLSGLAIALTGSMFALSRAKRS